MVYIYLVHSISLVVLKTSKIRLAYEYLNIRLLSGPDE